MTLRKLAVSYIHTIDDESTLGYMMQDIDYENRDLLELIR